MSHVELHKHSTWSLLDAVGTAEVGARRAAELGQPALAMTEHGVLSGVVHHMDACKDVGIMPIVGVEAYYRPRRIANTQIEAMRKRKEDVEAFQPYYHMVLLAKDIKGWRSLKLLTSESYRSGFYRKPCIDDELLDKWSEGLIISTSCVTGYVPRAILRGDDAAVAEHCAKLTRWVGDDWYFEIQPHGFEDLQIVNRAIVGLADQYGRPLVSTDDAHAPDASWIETQHVSVRIRTRGSMVADNRAVDADEKYEMLAADTAYIASAEDIRASYAEHHPDLAPRVVEEAISNTMWVASRCMPWMMDRSPKMPRYRGIDEQDYQELRRQVYAGLEAKGHHTDQRYIDAVEKELKIYKDRNVCAFFLIVGDVVRWMKSSDPLPPIDYDPQPPPSKQPQKVGLGRGSAGGCAVAYALGITLINPINYELRFERFLNPHRSGLPDIDLDFTSEGADLAKEYLKRRYGPDKVYDLVAHGTLAARSALQRVSRVYGLKENEINALSKKIPDDEATLPLETLREHIPELARLAEDQPKIFQHAARLQGSIGTVSEHAAGVVISGQPLDELMPVMKKSAKDSYLVTAFGETADKPTVSKLGFLKVDLLVVVELAKMAYAEDLVRRVYGEEIDLDALPALEDPRDVDPKAMEIFCRGLKNGIFQWDGRSNMASLTKRIKPENVHHLAAANAVVRPGVSVHAEEYVRRRHDSNFEYWDDSVEPALAETYGLPIFQEQIMSVFELLGGYSPAEADDVRRIMAKDYRSKDGLAQRNLARHKDRFIDSAASICRDGRLMAEMIWDFCGQACEYLFNRIHAEEYSLIALQGAYMKAHYPAAFYASLLTFPPTWVKKPENRNEFYERTVREARAFGIEVRPPDVNESEEGFTIRGDDVLFGLKGIKGLGPAMIADVLSQRPFSSLEDMGARLVACNRAGRQALGAAGALDRFGARENLTVSERAAAEEDRIGVEISHEDRIGDMREPLRNLIATSDDVDNATNGQYLVVGGELITGREVPTRSSHGPALKMTIAFGADEYKVSLAPWVYNDPVVKDLLSTDEPIVARGSKDVAWDCISATEIKAAREVLDMTTVPA
jgi:DNA polymerase-3 subunit alpha